MTKRSTAQRKVALVVNPNSGTCDPDQIVGMLERQGVHVQTFSVGDEFAAAASNPDVLAVAGGDGSIARAALAARSAQLPLGVIPAGTANDFARAAGISRDQNIACRVVARSKTSIPWDIGWVDDHPFLNTASIGLAIGAAKRGAPFKKMLGSRAYAVGAAASGLLDRPLQCSISIDGAAKKRVSIWQLTISNTGSFGGGAQLSADVDDHHLDVMYVRANVSSLTDAIVNRMPFAKQAMRRIPLAEGLASRSFLPLHAAGMKLAGRHAHPLARTRKGAEITVSADHELIWNIDGEIVVAADSCFVHIEPDSFSILS